MNTGSSTSTCDIFWSASTKANGAAITKVETSTEKSIFSVLVILPIDLKKTLLDRKNLVSNPRVSLTQTPHEHLLESLRFTATNTRLTTEQEPTGTIAEIPSSCKLRDVHGEEPPPGCAPRRALPFPAAGRFMEGPPLRADGRLQDVVQAQIASGGPVSFAGGSCFRRLEVTLRSLLDTYLIPGHPIITEYLCLSPFPICLPLLQPARHTPPQVCGAEAALVPCTKAATDSSSRKSSMMKRQAKPPPPSPQVTLPPSSPQRGASSPPHEGHFPPLWPVSLIPFLAPGSCHGFSPEGRSQVPSQGHGCHLWAGQDLPDTTHSFGAGSPKPREGRPCMPAALRTSCSPKLFAQTVRPSMVASPEHMQVDLSERLPSWLHSAALSCKRQKAHPWKEIPPPFSTKFQRSSKRGGKEENDDLPSCNRLRPDSHDICKKGCAQQWSKDAMAASTKFSLPQGTVRSSSVRYLAALYKNLVLVFLEPICLHCTFVVKLPAAAPGLHTAAHIHVATPTTGEEGERSADNGQKSGSRKWATTGENEQEGSGKGGYVTKAALKPFPRILPPSVGCLIYGVSDSELRSAVLHSRAMQLRKSCSGVNKYISFQFVCKCNVEYQKLPVKGLVTYSLHLSSHSRRKHICEYCAPPY
ncbi:hypothetical protein Anapl_12957 [Anas platyrhynchos]|uniref:Uncharacterized protein n=1 Tax=Anas platyrhynchos TaxID=8839 RepID=R0M565_ANAPL|nr:hypothetical protein Anapl_12957 [Anas platyrhynchos]